MKKYLFLIGLLLWLSGQVFSQALPDHAFNSKIRKFSGGWIAGDATFSISLPDNKTLWLFGDSFIGTAMPDSSIAAGSSFIRNCAILQDGDSMKALFGGTFSKPTPFVPSLKADSAWYWPEHGLVENDTLKIFMSEFIMASGPAGFNFKYASARLARFTYPDLVLVDLIKLPYYDHNRVCYGNSVLVENGYTYIYGRQEYDTVSHIPYPHIARAVAGNLTGAWEFYNGSNWVNNPAETKRISPAAVSQEFGVFKLNNKYVLLSQEIWFSTKILSYTAILPQGPWSNKQLLYQTPILYKDSFTYNAFPHPQFNENDSLLVSYNTNGTFWDIFKNVEIYRPMFIRVPFTMIDPTYVSVNENLQIKNNTGDVILYPNYPNPAKYTTKIKFTVSKKCFVSLHLNTIDGKEIQSYVNKNLDPGTYDVDIDINNLQSGVYSYRINNSSFKLIKN